MVRHHFGTKPALWRAVVDRAADRYRTAPEPHASRDLVERHTADPDAILDPTLTPG